MKNRGLVDDYLQRSKIRLLALNTLFEHESYADVVREAQEVVELVSKSLIRFLGSEPARVHDTSAQLEELRERIAKEAQSGLSELIRISRALRRDRELAFYGTEDLTPSEFYSIEDAREALDFAKRAVGFVAQVVRG